MAEASGWRRWPPRLAGQPIFYPVLNEGYARKIARDWNATREDTDYRGFVTRFKVRVEFLAAYEVHTVGAAWAKEYWIPAEALEWFNNAIVGKIEVIAGFQGGAGSEPVEVEPPIALPSD